MAIQHLDEPTEHPNFLLSCSLQSEELYPAGVPVLVSFTLANSSNITARVLTWYTPLEGLRARLFRVSRDGEDIPYRGRMVKRGTPALCDFVRIEPHKSVTVTIDLATGYNVSPPGKYHVELICGQLHVISADDRPLSPQDTHHTQCLPVNSISFQRESDTLRSDRESPEGA